MRQYEQGKAFCDQVVARAGTAGLDHVFSRSGGAADARGARAIPPRWLRRVGLDGALPAADVA